MLLDATEEVAGSFGAMHNPAALKVIDTLRIATARSTWRTCTVRFLLVRSRRLSDVSSSQLNEFRKFLSLKPFENFNEVRR